MTRANSAPDNLEIIVGTYEDYVVGYQAESISVKLNGVQNGTNKKHKGKDGNPTTRTGNVTNQMCLEQSFAVRGHSGSVRCLAGTPNGSFVFSAGYDEMMNLFSLKRRKLLQTTESAVNCAIFVGNSHLICGSEDSNIYIHECKASNIKLVKTLKGHKSAITSITAHPSGKILLSISKDQTMRTWNLIKGRCAYVTHIRTEAHLIEWSRTGNEFVIAANNEIYLYNNLGNLKQSIKMEKRVNSIEFINDHVFAVAIDSGSLEFFDMGRGDVAKTLIKLEAHETRIKSIKCLDNSKPAQALESDADDEDSSDEGLANNQEPETLFATASSDGSVKVWSMKVKHANILVGPREIAKVDVGARLTCMIISARKAG